MANPQSIAQSPAWMGLAADEVEDLDEPPEIRSRNFTSPQKFQRTTIRRPSDQQPSLLTKAILGQSDDDTYDVHHDSLTDERRRRSMASNISVASTADLTSDTGLTSPARTNTPSPPLPEMAILRFNEDTVLKPRNIATAGTTAKPQEPPRKRCIQFACNAKPVTSVPMVKTPSAQETTRRPCIKFACPARPASTQNTPPTTTKSPTSHPSLELTPQARVQPTRSAALTFAGPPSPRQANFRRNQGRGSAPRPKFLRASSIDLARDGSQFHEFAREMVREDDWIRQDTSLPRTKLTINDTLVKENHIRRLATEAEEEAELEEEDEEAGLDDEDGLDEDEDDALDEDEEDEDDEEDDDYDGADGYSTDEETGFADSDEEEDDDENMILWTPVQHRVTQVTSTLSSKIRRPSLHEQHSDSSTSTASARVRARRDRSHRLSIPADTPDLPDSTDFVCGTLDEDRPLEEAYLSCLAARRNEKLRIIPQDIDPSFPASDPEDEEEEELYNPVHHSSDDEETWMHGKMEDLDQEQGRSRRKKRNDGTSPKRYHSPPPKRHHSPPPKARGRSPKPLFERGSPRRVRSPAPKAMTTPAGSPRQGTNVKFQLAGRPGLIQTKSLPRPAALFRHVKHGRYPKSNHHVDGHVRGAIDIVKGLEKKRQRRKEKFHQKYCDRARRGQIPERKPLPGRGAERMKELGLLMAGKKDQGNYVLSI